MAHAFRYLIRWAAGVLLLSSVAAAWAQPSQVKAVQFTVFSLRSISGISFASGPTAARQAVLFYPTARSPRYSYTGPMPLRFFEATTGAVVAEASVPAEMRHALLLFLPLDTTQEGKENRAPALRYRIAVLDDAGAQHGAGGLTILNLSGLSLRGVVAGKPMTLVAGLNAPVAIGHGGSITLRTTFKNRSYQSFQGDVELGPRQRALLILFPPFYKGSLEVQSRLLVDEPAAQDIAPVSRQ